MAISYRIEPDDTSAYDGIVRMFHEALGEYACKTGKYPDKIVVTQPLYVLLSAHARDALRIERYSSLERCSTLISIMGIPMDVVISDDWYFMVGDPVKLDRR